jgi:hypothetical protein
MPRARRSVVRGLVMVSAIALAATLPSSASAFGENGGTEVSNGTAPANGTMVTHTDDIPANATQASFGVQPQPGTDAHAFDEITGVLVDDFPWLSKISKRNQAVVACVMLSYLPYANKAADEPITIVDAEKQLMLLSVCLQMAASIPGPPTARDRATAAAGGCGRLNPAVKLQITRTSRGYQGKVIGKIRDASRPRLTVKCRRSGKGLLFTVKPRKRGQKLRAAGGPQLAIAYRNPTNKPVGIRTTFKVN